MRVIFNAISILYFITLMSFFLFQGCSQPEQEKKLFIKLTGDHTGVNFANTLNYDRELNPYTYRNFYNGGGVGIGDFNNDGLQDLILTGNQVSNRLYLNKGDFRFEDITESAGLASEGVWSTGVSVVDINGDGWLDIYICKSGKPGGEKRYNELFINNGDLTFTEKAEEYGLDVEGLSTDATFFDYDRDGDLDMYLLNNSFEPITGINMEADLRNTPDPEGGDKLFRNQTISSGEKKSSSPIFVEVTQQAGIYSSKIGFGLDIIVGDINDDMWPDIYITNDFFERDYLYLNNKDGTFTEVLPDAIQSISLSSMGGDMGDINHDGLPEIYVTDMLPVTQQRVKSKTAFDFWDEYIKRVDNGYHYQFIRNTLQLNNGLQPGHDTVSVPQVSFSEIGRLAGVEATDWSWTSLFADFNQDGFNDLIVTNGIYKDLTDQDYISDNNTLSKVRSIVVDDKPVNILFDEIPSVPIPNLAFAGTDSLLFTNKAEDWGLSEPGFSNGAVYADLDNDGDLDLVINNVNQQTSIYKNQAEQVSSNQKSLTIQLEGIAPNTLGVGSKVEVWAEGKRYYREQMPNRGFQSSVDPRIHVGLGAAEEIDSVIVFWPDGSKSTQTQVKADQLFTIKQPDNNSAREETKSRLGNTELLFKDISGEINLNYRHRENDSDPFDRSPLYFESHSREGPASCAADINNDGLIDLYLGGAKGQAGSIFIQQKGKNFQLLETGVFASDRESEDTDCTWVDANGNGLMDLYVASGGSEFPSSSSALSDRLYINTENGFTRMNEMLPSSRFEVTATVKAADFDQDGDIDLFTGSRAEPFAYGIPQGGHLLQNDGTGNFEDVTEDIAPSLRNLGMLTDADWIDFDDDGDLDLVIAGEWMPVTLLKNERSENGDTSFKNISSQLGLNHTDGLWKSLLIEDLDNDGYPDIIAGNHGLNTQLHADSENPMKLWTNDFDQNGSIEQITSVTQREENIPLILRQDLLKQMPEMEKRAPDFNTYAEMNMSELFSENELANSIVLSLYELRSSIFWNEKGKGFKRQSLPKQAQFAPIFAINVLDGSADEKILITGGNLSTIKPQFGAYLSSYGMMIETEKSRNLTTVSPSQSGLFLEGEVRNIISFESAEDTLLLIIRNNKKPQWFKKTID